MPIFRIGPDGQHSARFRKSPTSFISLHPSGGGSPWLLFPGSKKFLLWSDLILFPRLLTFLFCPNCFFFIILLNTFLLFLIFPCSLVKNYFENGLFLRRYCNTLIDSALYSHCAELDSVWRPSLIVRCITQLEIKIFERKKTIPKTVFRQLFRYQVGSIRERTNFKSC